MDIFRRNPFFLLIVAMGPLQNPLVIWVKEHLAGWETMQRGKENKEITSFKKTNILSFQCLTASLPSSKELFFVTYDRILQ